MIKHPIKFGILTGVLAGALIFALNSFAFHGGPIQRIEGLHDEGDGFLSRPVMMGGDDGTDIKNINVDPTTGDVQVDVTNVVTVDLAGNNDVTTVKANAIAELGITELIGINEQVTADQWSASTATTFTGTGEIRKVCLFATEDQTGVIFTPAGNLTLFDADPSISADDATILAAERITIHIVMSFVASDWEADANGASNCQDVNEVFSNGTMFAAWHSAAGETQWNSAANDDEQLEVNFWYRRDT